MELAELFMYTAIQMNHLCIPVIGFVVNYSRDNFLVKVQLL